MLRVDTERRFLRFGAVERINLHSKYKQSENVVARDGQVEFIMIFITSEVGGQEGEIFTLSQTGRAIWDKFGGNNILNDVIKDLNSEFTGELEDIIKSVLGLPTSY